MTWLLIAIFGQIILGTAAIADKLFLRSRVSDPIIYTFWIGILGIFSATLLPFGFLHLAFPFILIGIVSGIVFILSLLALYTVLAKTDASSSLPFIAALVPLSTLPFSIVLIAAHVSGMDIVGIVFLVTGAFFFFFATQKAMRMNLILWIAGSAALYGFSSVLQKIVFEHSNFVTGFFWAKMGEVTGALFLLLLPQLRKRILHARVKISGSSWVWYAANRVWASFGSVLLNIAIFLSHPALVQSTQSFRYVVIFTASWLVLHERVRGRELRLKIIATVFIAIGIGWLGVIEYARSIPYDANRTITWGITFSSKYSQKLGLNWKENFNAIIDQLHPKEMRLIAYWDDIEKDHGIFDFSDLDWELARAREQGISVVLVIGMKTPRWPECHVPVWARELTSQDRERALNDYIPRVINRYRDDPEIDKWQIENEPFLKFGLCAMRNADFLEHEVALVRSLDSGHQIIITDGGEFGSWNRAIRAGDIFGTTMYRRVYPPSMGRYIGVVDYPLSPSFFRFRQKFARWLTGEYKKPFIVIELQAEPWGAVEVPLLSYEEQINIFPPDYFRETIQYAKDTGFDEYYLWGAEWWYYVGITHNNWTYWNEVKNLMK